MTGKFIISLALFLALISSASAAEEMPLYRHAVEKWEPDPYRAVVIFNSENPVDKEKGVKVVDGLIQDPARSLNLIIGRADIGDKSVIDENTNAILKAFKPDRLPFTVIYFPSVSDVEIPLWAGYLTVQSAEAICDSPARREIARRLLKGDDAVWIFIESGDEGNDAGALQMLSEEIRISSSALPRIPSPDHAEMEVDGNTGDVAALPAPSPLKMSIIRIPRDDKSEMILLEMLNCIEPEMINSKTEPAIAPVYGKGRLLDILSSDEVTRENVRHAIQKLAAPFSGEGKLSDSGTDLLMAVSWNAMLKDKSQVDKLLPQQKAFADAGDGKAVDDILPSQNENFSMPDPEPEITPAGEQAPAAAPVPMKIINLFLVLVIALLAILFVVIVLRMKR